MWFHFKNLWDPRRLAASVIWPFHMEVSGLWRKQIVEILQMMRGEQLRLRQFLQLHPLWRKMSKWSLCETCVFFGFHGVFVTPDLQECLKDNDQKVWEFFWSNQSDIWWCQPRSIEILFFKGFPLISYTITRTLATKTPDLPGKERELKQLDVPDENLVELRSEEEVVEKELKSWLIQDSCPNMCQTYSSKNQGFFQKRIDLNRAANDVVLFFLFQTFQNWTCDPHRTGVISKCRLPKMRSPQKILQVKIEEYGISSADFHAEFGEQKRNFAVLAFTTHRVARSMVNAPPPGLLVNLRCLLFGSTKSWWWWFQFSKKPWEDDPFWRSRIFFIHGLVGEKPPQLDLPFFWLACYVWGWTEGLLSARKLKPCSFCEDQTRELRRMWWPGV